METTSVGTADSVRSGLTPIFDELVGRYGQPLAGESAVDDMVDALRADEAVATAS